VAGSEAGLHGLEGAQEAKEVAPLAGGELPERFFLDDVETKIPVFAVC